MAAFGGRQGKQMQAPAGRIRCMILGKRMSRAQTLFHPVLSSICRHGEQMQMMPPDRIIELRKNCPRRWGSLIFLGALLRPPPHSSRYHISDATRNLCGFRLSGLCCNEWLRRACSRAWLRYVQNIWEVLEHWEGLGMGLLSGQWGFIWTCSTIHFQARCTGICERMSWPSQCFNARHVIEQFDGRPPWKKSLVVLRRLAAYKIVMLMLCWCSMAHLPSHSAGREPKPAKQPLDCSSCSCSI